MYRSIQCRIPTIGDTRMPIGQARNSPLHWPCAAHERSVHLDESAHLDQDVPADCWRHCLCHVRCQPQRPDSSVRPVAFRTDHTAPFCFGSDATRVRSASTDDEISPRRQTSGVVIWACAFGIGCRRTFACGMVSSTDSGIKAMPAPAVTQAMMA